MFRWFVPFLVAFPALANTSKQTGLNVAFVDLPRTEIAKSVSLELKVQVDRLHTASVLLTDGKNDESLRFMDQFLSDSPDSILLQEAYFLQGLAYYGLGRHKDAAYTFLAAHIEEPATDISIESLFNLAVVFHDLGEAEEACLVLQDVQNKGSQRSIAKRAQIAFAELSCD